MKFVVIFVALCIFRTLTVRDGYEKAKDAKEGQFPYIVLIKVKHPHTGNYMPICAGAIISEHDILTNAVCASACQHPPNCKAYVGRVRVNSGGKEVIIKDTVWHETYYEMEVMKQISSEEIQAMHDIGIIHTEKIAISETVRTIELQYYYPIEEQTMLMAGWGADSDVGFTIQPKHHSILKYGIVRIKPCTASTPEPPKNLNKNLCFFGKGKQEGVLPGISDMGAPLVYDEKLIGIGYVRQLMRESANDTEQVSFWLRVEYYKEWIAKNIYPNYNHDEL